MKKKVLSVLLAVCLLIGCLPMAASAEGETSGTCGDNVTWNYDLNSKTLTISGSGGMYNYTSGGTCGVFFPTPRPWKEYEPEIEHLEVEQGVTSIGVFAFCDLSSLKDAVIADSVAYIYPHAFNNCKSLEDITLSKNLTDLSVYTFAGCTSLVSIVIPENVSIIGAFAFSGCTSLRDVSMPEGLCQILREAFVRCSSLTSITIPNSVYTIGQGAFKECTGLTSVFIPDSVTEIERHAFLSCTGLTELIVDENNPEYASFEGALCSKDQTRLIVCPPGKAGAFAVPDGVMAIDEYAFNGCSELTAVTLPNSLIDIDYGAFYDCTGLTSITIPSSAAKINRHAFLNCTGLTEFIVDENNPEYVALEGALCSKKQTELMVCPSGKTGAFTIPDSVTSIGEWVFSGCSGLTSVTIPDSVTSIGEWAFSDCSGLTSVTIPNGVTALEDWTFGRCSALTAIAIPSNVTSIGYQVFCDCDKLTIYGEAGSCAETYANENNIPFVAGSIPTSTPEPTPAPTPAPGPVTPVTPAEPDPEPTVQFADIPAGAYYADAVQWAVENGVASGMDETHFSPNSSCTRAQAVTFLWRAAGKPEPQNTGAKFNDVKAGSYYEKAVQWAVENGVTAGTGETSFSPNATCTRAQIVTFLYRAENSPEITGNNSFNDVKTGTYYENAVKWAVENNITSGTGGNQFSPDNNCVRGQIVTFLYRYKK